MNFPKGAALLADMGVGKSKMVIDLAEIMHDLGMVKKVLVISPLSIVNSWCDELTLHASKSQWEPIIGSKTKRVQALNDINQSNGKLQWGLINVDGVKVIEDDIGKWDMVVIDEVTIMKNRTTQRFKCIDSLFRNVYFKIIMSGNPIPKSPIEIFAPYKFIDPGVFGDNFYKFRDHYFTIDMFNNIIGFKNDVLKKEFHSKMHGIAFRKKKEECLTLPSKIFQNRYVELSEPQKKVYDTMRKEAIAAYEDRKCSAPVLISKILRLSQIAGGNFPDEQGGTIPITPNPKLEELLFVLEEIPSQEQVVVWARFTAEIQQIEMRLKKENISCVTFYGATSPKDRISAAEQFRTKKVRVFIGNTATAGKGVNFLVGATHVVFYSLDYSYENYDQAIARTHRSGTKGDKVLYVHLIAKGTVDFAVLNVLKKNGNFSEAILNREISL